MKNAKIICFLLFLAGCASGSGEYKSFPKQTTHWYGIHLIDQELSDLEKIESSLPELERIGINLIILEVDYNFEFKSHPELRAGDNPITKEAAQKLVKKCKKHGIRLIPEFQCFGHQSWDKYTHALLTKYPEFDLTPGAFSNNEGIYCREWNPLDPKLKKIIFELMDEIINAFSADAFHVGMDEIFLITNQYATATKDMDPAIVFANAVKDYHAHLVGKRKVEMLMWGDRLIDGKKYTQYGCWEASCNGTAPAVDMIPKDIIICDWHYEKMDYPSIPMFLKKGFRVLPSSYKSVYASQALIQYSIKQDNPKMLGHLFTTWGGKMDTLVKYRPMIKGMNHFYYYLELPEDKRPAAVMDIGAEKLKPVKGKVLIDDFEDGDTLNRIDTSWEADFDSNNLGTVFNPSPFVPAKNGANNSKYCARIWGHFGKSREPWPWALLYTRLSPDGYPVDLNGFTAIELYVKGDGKKYELCLIKEAVKDYANFRSVFIAGKEWTKIIMPINKFIQPDWGKQLERSFTDHMSIQIGPSDMNDEDFDISVDDIRLVK